MQNLKRSNLRNAVMVSVFLVMTCLALIIAPTFADTSPGTSGSSGGTMRAVPGQGGALTVMKSFDEKRVRDYKITDAGDISWCDVRTDHDDPGTPQIDSVTLTTSDPKINNALLTAYMSGYKISAKGHKITKPQGREWPGYETVFYEIDEITIINISPKL